jgi:hypothetical protein
MSLAQSLTKILKDIVEDKDKIEGWGRLLLFTYATLPVPQKSDNVKNLTTWVKNKSKNWDFSAPQPHPPRPPNKKAPSNDMKKVEAKLADGDIRGAIRLVCSDDTIAPNNDEALRALHEKHPPHPLPINFPVPNNDNNDVTTPPVDNNEVTKAISSFPPGSAGGLDGMRPQILKDLLSTQGDVVVHLAQAIMAFLDVILKGEVHPSIRPIFFGASLTALKKKTGGIRPIAVGNTWRRLAAKIILSRMTPDLVSYFSPHQLGVGVKGGAEAGAHAARAYWNHTTPPKHF